MKKVPTELRVEKLCGEKHFRARQMCGAYSRADVPKQQAGTECVDRDNIAATLSISQMGPHRRIGGRSCRLPPLLPCRR